MRALVIVAVLAGTADAETSYVKPPAGWTSDVEQARTVTAKANSVTHFGGAPSIATVEVFGPPELEGVLYVTAIVGDVTEHRDAAARVEVDSFHASPQRVGMVSPKIAVDSWAENAEPAKRQVSAKLQWQDPEAGSVTRAVLMIVADDTTMVAVTAECITNLSTSVPARTACWKALDTLDLGGRSESAAIHSGPGIPLDKRVAISLAPVGTTPPPPAEPAIAAPTPGVRPMGPPTTMTDGTRAPLPPMTVQTETKRTTDRRPVYVGLGIVVLAALFWWNRRRRDRFDAEEHDER